MGVIAWLRSVGRQRIVGWILIVFGTLYVLYFVRGRLFEAGDPIGFMEWFAAAMAVGMIMMGTMNIRLADIRDRLENEARQRHEAMRARAEAERKALRQQSTSSKKNKS